jgi:hypothetical protein
VTNPARPLQGLELDGPHPALVKLHAQAVAEVLVSAIDPVQQESIRHLYQSIGFYGFLSLLVSDPRAKMLYNALLERCVRSSFGCVDEMQRAGEALQAYCRPETEGGGE